MTAPDPRHVPSRATAALALALLAGLGPVTAVAATLPQDSVAQVVPDTSLADPSAPDPADVPEPVDADQARTDEELRAELQAVLDRIPEFSRIDVSVEAGVVRLEGQVLASSVAEQAVELTRSFDGVRFVVDAVRETSSLQERLEPVRLRLREFAIGAVASLPLLVVALGIVLFAWLLGRLVRGIRLPRFLRSRNPFLQSLIQGLLQGAVLLAGVLVALDLLGATALVGAVAGTAGLAGLAIGFAFKDIVENYLAGMLLGFRQPFAKNDHVVVAGHEGKVVRLTWRDTILMTMEGNHVRVPNGQIFASTLLNYSRNPKRRFQFDFGVGPADDIAAAQDLGIETLRGMRSILDDPPPRALTVDMGDSNVQVRWLAWVDQRESDLGATRSEAIRLVKVALESAGVTLPSPEYLVRLTGTSEEGRAAPETRPAAPSPPPPEVTEERDTSVDLALDTQISEDREASDEEDLLVNDAPETEPSEGTP